MRITILSGSARQNNNTIRVALAVKRLLEPSHSVKLVDFINYDIPLTSHGGIDISHLTTFQKELFNAMAEAHLVIFISPEYNWSTTPEILNLLHVLPTKQMPQILNNKVYSFIGVSTGKGGKTPAIHLMQVVNKLISFGNFQSVVSPKIFESHYTKEVLSENGVSLGNIEFDKGLIDFCEYTIKITERWFK
ncbi:MAG: NAD(P)H-dependent oxidoreductase [Bacteroidia bacterium]